MSLVLTAFLYVCVTLLNRASVASVHLLLQATLEK